ncbi:uncharacterized protein LOC142533373 [Primulina tabacum]|uniref:uncharacterized protein LOC142533373 n=1 Tax=Primulina tabacum TaxID=48773 RepID=UPI003F5AD267
MIFLIIVYMRINRDSGFGRALAMAGCTKNDEKYDPVGWWHLYGNGVPKLQKMAKRILSLTTSSSGCERNCSTFEGIHTKKRNRLDTGRLNNLVYVQFNAKIINKKRRQEEKGVDVLLASEATMAQGWIVDGGDEDVETNVEDVRELHKEEFVSDEEEEKAMDFEFESDTEEVLEKYGDELEDLDV